MARKIIRQIGRPVMVFKHHSAMARVRELGGGVWEVAYSGVLTEKTYQSLRRDVLTETKSAGSLLLRMEASLIAMPEICAIPCGVYSPDCPMAAIVVREDQLDYWSAYSRLAAEAGAIRAVFMNSQLKLARDWVGRGVWLHTKRP